MAEQHLQLVFCILAIFTNCLPVINAQGTTFTCTAPGTFADPNDCHSFYTCDSNNDLTQGTCTEYGRYDPVQGCVFETCTNTVTPTPTTGTQAPTVGTQSPPTDSEGFTCLAEGYYADPTDCHSYYNCDKTLTPGRRTCTSQGYFNTDTQECELGACPGTGATDSPTVAPTDSPITTAPEFICFSQGYYPDPTDCRAFYSCSAALVPTRGMCMGGGGHFSPESSGCEVGPCTN